MWFALFFFCFLVYALFGRDEYNDDRCNTVGDEDSGNGSVLRKGERTRKGNRKSKKVKKQHEQSAERMFHGQQRKQMSADKHT